MTWKSEIKSEIIDNGYDLGYFTLQEFHKLTKHTLEKEYPKNKTIKFTIQRTFQELRDEKYLAFVERGKYKVLSKENDEFINFVDTYHKNQI